MAIKRKLTALGFPNVDINLTDQQAYRKLVIWLEENKIKHYNEQTRKPLINIAGKDWAKVFEKYVSELLCPISTENAEACLDWCLGYAIQLEYSKNKDNYNKYAVDNLKTSNVPNVIAANPLDHLDLTGKEFLEGINNLANILKVAPHADQLVTLEACSKVVQKRLHFRAVENPAEYILKGTPYPFQNADLGFDLGDTSLNYAAKVLRLLYIQDLRNLQTRANECIVAVQSVTANPKTDTKLGKVGTM